MADAVFLTAKWHHLAMLNYAVDPVILEPLVPAGTKLDLWHGQAYVSVVGFRFLDTRVLGLPIPFHRDFEEVNLRFYVRRRVDDQWRRGVVFVKELVPRAAIAWVARALFNENYQAVPMSFRMEAFPGGPIPESGPADPRSVCYSWRFQGRENRLRILVDDRLPVRACRRDPIEPGSQTEFITEHYFGYSRQKDGGTLEYRVYHPRWRTWPVREARLECDVSSLYGEAFKSCLCEVPASAILADGSEVTVYRGVRV